MRRAIAIVVALFLLLILFDRFVLVELTVRRIGISLLFAAAGALASIGAGFLVRRGARDVALKEIGVTIEDLIKRMPRHLRRDRSRDCAAAGFGPGNWRAFHRLRHLSHDPGA